MVERKTSTTLYTFSWGETVCVYVRDRVRISSLLLSGTFDQVYMLFVSSSHIFNKTFGLSFLSWTFSELSVP